MPHKHETPAGVGALDRGDVGGSGELATGGAYSASATLRGAATQLRAVLLDLKAYRWTRRRVVLLRDLAATCSGADLEAVNASLRRVERGA